MFHEFQKFKFTQQEEEPLPPPPPELMDSQRTQLSVAQDTELAKDSIPQIKALHGQSPPQPPQRQTPSLGSSQSPPASMHVRILNLTCYLMILHIRHTV